jgi:hypothetical protein
MQPAARTGGERPAQPRGDVQCWCRNRDGARDPYEISHNDRVRFFNGCQCRHGRCTNQVTSPEMRRRLDELEHRSREERISSGRMNSSDVTHIARNPHRYPHFFRNPPPPPQ